jgi:hypothetical protein
MEGSTGHRVPCLRLQIATSKQRIRGVRNLKEPIPGLH